MLREHNKTVRQYESKTYFSLHGNHGETSVWCTVLSLRESDIKYFIDLINHHRKYYIGPFIDGYFT